MTKQNRQLVHFQDHKMTHNIYKKGIFQKVAGSNLEPLSKAPNPQCHPGAVGFCPLLLHLARVFTPGESRMG